MADANRDQSSKNVAGVESETALTRARKFAFAKALSGQPAPADAIRPTKRDAVKIVSSHPRG